MIEISKKAFLDYESDKYFISHTISDLKIITDKSIQLTEKYQKEFLKNEYLQEKIYNELVIEQADIAILM